MIMNMKRTALILLAVTAALSAVSCVRDDDPVFEQSASVRLQNALKNAQSVLVGAENGWLMSYYPDPEQSYGGYTYTMKFSQEEVEVWSELFEGSSKSLYRMSTDNGPVLSFDTGNYNFHFFATPSGSARNLYGESGRYQAYKGDFEFLIISATSEEVVLKGKRTGNRIVMHPLAAGQDPQQVADNVSSCAESLFVSTFTGTIGGEDAFVYLYLGDRWADIKLTGEQYADDENAVAKAPYMFTEDGILFYEPVEVGSYTIEGFRWDAENQILASLAGASTDASLKGKLPEGWHAYEDFLGDYVFTYRDGASTMDNISIVQDVAKQSYLIKGLSSLWDMKATYDLSGGQMNVTAQAVGTQGSYTVWAAAWDSNGGSLTWNEAAGQFGQLNDDNTVITWRSNGAWAGNNVDAFIVWYLNGTSSAGQGSAPWVWKNNSTQLWGWQKFTRK